MATGPFRQEDREAEAGVARSRPASANRVGLRHYPVDAHEPPPYPSDSLEWTQDQQPETD